MSPLYIINNKVSVACIRAIPLCRTATYRNKHSYGNNTASNFITTVVNRMGMPEMQTESAKNVEFKFMYDEFYRVILHYTNWPEESNKSVARRVKMAVPFLALKDCDIIVNQTFKYGICIVCTIQQNKAILYRDALIQAGLNATLEEA